MQDQIEFIANYGFWSREKASHHVNFVADQIPGESGMVDVLSAAEDQGAAYETGSFIYMYPEGKDLDKPQNYSLSTMSNTESGVTNLDNSNNPPTDGGREFGTRKALDAMSERALERRDIKRIDPSEVSAEQARKSKFDFSGDKPAYIAKFGFDVEFDTKNGTSVGKNENK